MTETSTETMTGTSADGSTPAPPAERGRLVISDQVVRTIAEASAREVPSVTRTASPFNPLSHGLPRADVTRTSSHARVTVEVATGWDRPLFEVAADVRGTVAEAITRMTGLTVDIVNVEISSVLSRQPDSPTRSVRRNLL